jgi:cytochrome P450
MRRFPGQPDDLRWDPFDESLKDDPHPVWRRLRDEAPVYYNDQFDFWALSRFGEVD